MSTLDVRTTVPAQPFYFESGGQPIFAWLHRPAPGAARHQGVVLCPPWGHEQVHSHRSLRHLAEALADAGFDVLRFDYANTGDSGGDGPSRATDWQTNLRDAIAWLRNHVGVERVSLVGLRLGATLAAQFAATEEVDGLVLWAPVVKGRAFVREQKALSLTSGAVRSDSAGGIEAAGFVLADATAQEISQLDLLQTQPRCRRALILARDVLPIDTALLEHYQKAGIAAEQRSASGYADMMAEPHESRVPDEAIATITRWLTAAPVEDAIPPASVMPDSTRAIVVPEAVRESVFTFGEEPRRFGILSEPLETPVDDLPLVVMLNAGSTYRIGPNRLHVELARQLARHGFRSLRLDLGGLGDSAAWDGQTENDPYPATAFRDLDLAMRELNDRHGANRIVLLGLCSGAYTAFQSAAQFATPLLVESLVINPLTFYWHAGMSLEASPAQQLQSFRQSLASALRPGKWLKLLTGRSKLGFTGILRLLAQRWQARRGKSRVTPHIAAAVEALPTHPALDDLPGDLRRLAKTGRHLACFFARSDPGYDLLALQAGATMHDLRRAGTMSVAFIENADHTFSRRAARQALTQAILDHLQRRYTHSTEVCAGPASSSRPARATPGFKIHA